MLYDALDNIPFEQKLEKIPCPLLSLWFLTCNRQQKNCTYCNITVLDSSSPFRILVAIIFMIGCALCKDE